MRKITIMEHISLDGVIEHDEDYVYGAWTTSYRSPAGFEAVLKAYGANFDLLLGRRTYDSWAKYWPKVENNPMADNLNAATKYVVTHTPNTLKWGPVKDLGTDMVKGIQDLKATDGPDLIVAGSTSLTSLLFEQGLVDEVVLITYPVLLGQGKRLFSDKVDARKLEFMSTNPTPTGVLINTYRYVGLL